MAWSRLPTLDGVKAGKHWLANLEPSKETRRRRSFAQFKRQIETALVLDKNLSIAFREMITIARWLGRVDGLREGLELYAYGERILEKNPRAFQSVMKYAISYPDNISAPEICDYLDEEIRRTVQRENEQKKQFRVKIRPPEEWGCNTWNEALKRKRSNVDVFFHNAIKEACSTEYNKLCAWRTWGLKGTSKKKARAADAED
jgi:hypothetical protein